VCVSVSSMFIIIHSCYQKVELVLRHIGEVTSGKQSVLM